MCKCTSLSPLQLYVLVYKKQERRGHYSWGKLILGFEFLKKISITLNYFTFGILLA